MPDQKIVHLVDKDERLQWRLLRAQVLHQVYGLVEGGRLRPSSTWISQVEDIAFLSPGWPFMSSVLCKSRAAFSVGAVEKSEPYQNPRLWTETIHPTTVYA